MNRAGKIFGSTQPALLHPCAVAFAPIFRAGPNRRTRPRRFSSGGSSIDRGCPFALVPAKRQARRKKAFKLTFLPHCPCCQSNGKQWKKALS
ncbi:hypothetical protein B4113_0738 [Geobacillus sp. B4113_201601]|nr:hypothetical protein B4113_0738 [Geobacillus sp. B4113_201601]